MPNMFHHPTDCEGLKEKLLRENAFPSHRTQVARNLQDCQHLVAGAAEVFSEFFASSVRVIKFLGYVNKSFAYMLLELNWVMKIL